MIDAGAAIRAYCAAFAARDADSIVALFAERGLYEMPLLRTRMVGSAEIAAGLARAFAIMTACSIELQRVRANGATALAEGTMTATVAREPRPMTAPFALVAAMAGDRVGRLSVYLDARPHRLWSDGSVLALGR
ncbi:MAG: nuclear transport factor 2 family protein [Alphaproteobacteria bacterium]